MGNPTLGAARPGAVLSSASNNTHPQWWKDPGLRKLNLLLVGCMLGSIGTGYDTALIGGLLANNQWFGDMGLIGPTGMDVNLLGLLIASQALGGLGSFLAAPWLADKVGRRWCIIAANMAMIGTILGQTFTQSAVQFLGTRLVLGFLSNFILLPSAAMIPELAHPRQRGQIGALFFTFFYVGAITAAWTSYGALSIGSSWSWRLPVVMQLFWNVVQTISILVCPESPRWLINNDRSAEAKAILAKYHGNSDDEDPLVVLEFSEICASVELDRQRDNAGWKALFATPGNRKRVVICVVLGFSIQWVGNGIVSYYFAPILNTVGITSQIQQQGINGGLQIFNWILAVCGALFAEKAGRKLMLLISAVGMLIFMALVTICSAVYAQTGSSGAGYAVIVFLFLFLGCYDVGFTPIPLLYINEIFPTNLRAKGNSIIFCSTMAALCFNQYVNPIALASIEWKYYFVYIGVLIGVILFIFFYLPETKGRSLEEVAGLFDTEEAAAVANSVAAVLEKKDNQVLVVEQEKV